MKISFFFPSVTPLAAKKKSRGSVCWVHSSSSALNGPILPYDTAISYTYGTRTSSPNVTKQRVHSTVRQKTRDTQTGPRTLTSTLLQNRCKMIDGFGLQCSLSNCVVGLLHQGCWSRQCSDQLKRLRSTHAQEDFFLLRAVFTPFTVK